MCEYCVDFEYCVRIEWPVISDGPALQGHPGGVNGRVNGWVNGRVNGLLQSSTHRRFLRCSSPSSGAVAFTVIILASLVWTTDAGVNSQCRIVACECHQPGGRGRALMEDEV